MIHHITLVSHTLFLHYVSSLGVFAYLLVFVGMILEGDVIFFTAVFLAHQRILDLDELLLAVLAGALIGDILWYKIGERLDKKSGFFRRLASKISKSLDRHLVKRPLSTLFIAKFTYGIYHAVLLRAGALKLPFKSFFKVISSSTVVWMLLVGGLAYFSSESFNLVKRYLKYGEIGLLIGFVFFILLTNLISKLGRKEIEEKNNGQ